MSQRYPGGVITKTPTAPTIYSAPGVWTLDQAMQARKEGNWPGSPYYDSKFNVVGELMETTTSVQVPNTTITDSASTPNTISRTGNPAQSTFTPFSNIDGSVFFNGVDAAVTASSGDNPGNFGLSTASFTIEVFIYPSSIASTQTIACYNISPATANSDFGWKISQTTSGTITFSNYSGSSVLTVTGGYVCANQWNHIAVTRSGTSATVYVNGVGVTGTVYATSNLPTGSPIVTIGADRITANFFKGLMSNFRIVNGSVVYTTNFQPPTASLTAITNTKYLCFQVTSGSSNNALKDNSGNSFVFGNLGTCQMPVSPFGLLSGSGAMFFDGASGISTSTLTAIGTSNYTVEFWVNMSSFDGNPVIVDLRDTVPSGDYYQFLTTGQLTTSSGLSASKNASVGVWNHYAIVRSGTGTNLTKMYMNGVLVATTTVATNFTSTYVTVGKNGYASSNYVRGYVSNFRIVNNTALYAGTFKPPFAALTTTNSSSSYPATTNVTTGITATDTKLLLNTANASFMSATGSSLNNNNFLDSGPYNWAVTRGSLATQGSNSPFLVTGANSSAFTPDYASAWWDTSPNQHLYLGASNFTFEMWLIPFSNATGLLYWGQAGSGNPATALYISLSGNIMSWGTSAATPSSNSITLSYTTWNHIALVRNGATITMYLNGVAQNTVSVGTTALASGAWNILGYLSYGSSPPFFRGWISNFRLVRSAVYTSNFTVPTSPLTAIDNTLLLVCQNSSMFMDASSYRTICTSNGGWYEQNNYSPFLNSNVYSTTTNYGSIYLNGSSYLTLPSSPQFRPGVGDFTLDGWCYPETNTDTMIVYNMAYSGNNYFVLFHNASSGNFQFYINNTIVTSPSTNVIKAGWNHFAVVRSKGVVTVYVNGIGGTPVTNTSDISGDYVPTIGRYTHSASQFYQGFISNLRYVNGKALYVSNFAVPTTPSQAVNGATFLLGATNAAMYDASMVGDYITVGDTVLSNSVGDPFAGSNYAMKFDGTGDWMRSQSTSVNPNRFPKDFTIEAWIYPISWATGDASIISGDSYSLRFSRYGANNNLGVAQNAVGWYSTASPLPATGQWSYVAVTRSGTTLKVYINGVQTDSVTCSVDFSAPSYLIGAADNSGTGAFNGYISNLRITPGYARTISATTASLPWAQSGSASTSTTSTTTVFTGSGTWTAPAGVTSVNALIVGGGGPGYSPGTTTAGDGGGGGGGYLYQTSIPVTPGVTYPIIVGGGGAITTSGQGTVGGNSTAFTYTAFGGGSGGGYNTTAALSGGSGGGAGGTASSPANTGAAGVSGQGYAGGNGYNSTYSNGGGGGGAGAIGSNGGNGSGGGGNGGVGVYNSTFSTYGDSGYFSGGGGGGTNNSSASRSSGGSGGGGAGGYRLSGVAADCLGVPGKTNTGGGGGGGGYVAGITSYGGKGGSGIVIISY